MMPGEDTVSKDDIAHLSANIDSHTLEPSSLPRASSEDLIFEILESITDVLEFLNEPTLEVSALSPDAFSIERIQSAISLQKDASQELQSMPALVAVRFQGKYLALFQLSDIDTYSSTCNLACIISTSHSQQILSQGFDLLLDYLFQEKRVHRVEVDVKEGPGSEVIIRLLQNSGFCFEGVKREAFRRQDEIISEGTFQPLATSWCDVMSFSLLSQERGEAISESIASANPDAMKEDNDSRLIYKARYEGIESIVVRAVIMKESAKLPQEFVSGTSSPHDLCLLLLKRGDLATFQSVEELPGAEVFLDQEGLHEALSRAVFEATKTTIKQPLLFLTSFDFLREDGKRVREIVFRVSVEGNVLLDQSMHSSFRWVPLQHLVKTPLHPEIMAILFTCNDKIDYVSETHFVRDEDIVIEEVRSHLSELTDALAHGLHVNAYAARGFGLQQSIGIAVRDKSGHIIGGALGEFQYGGFYCPKLWVDSQYWGQGWKKRLVDRVEHVARSEGARFIIFSCMDWEFVRPLQRMGYKIEWQRSGYDRGSKLIYLRKEISKPQTKQLDQYDQFYSAALPLR